MQTCPSSEKAVCRSLKNYINLLVGQTHLLLKADNFISDGIDVC